MNVDVLEERIINLEIAVTNQERIIEDFNLVIIEQGKLIDKLVKQNRYLLDSLNDNNIKPISEETPPPHY